MPCGGGLVQAQPARRGVLARDVRAAAPVPRVAARDRRRDAARPARRAAAARLGSARARPGALPGSAARWWRTARRRAAHRRCGRPARGAATPGAAATAGPPGTPPRRSGRTAPPPPGRAAAPVLPRAHLPGLGRQDERELLEQIVPGPGRMPVRHQGQRLGQRPGLGLGRGRSGWRPAAVMLASLCAPRAARVRHRRRDPRQVAAEGGVPSPRERVPVDRARVLALA